MTAAQVKKNALALAPSQRLRLVQDIWDSLTVEPETIEIPEHHGRIIEQRWASHHENPLDAIPLSKAKAMIRRRLRHKK